MGSEDYKRILSPDIARGFLLLFTAIASVTTTWAVYSQGIFAVAGAIPHTPLDRVVGMINYIFIHGRTGPVFKVLLGYGIGILFLRYTSQSLSVEKAREQLGRRYLILGVIGFSHMLFISFGDALLAYSAVALLIIWLALKIRTSTIEILFWVSYVLSIIGALVGIIYEFILRNDIPDTMRNFASRTSSPGYSLNIPSTYAEASVLGLQTILSPLTSNPLSSLLSSVSLTLLGFAAARAGVLENVPRYAYELKRICTIGFSISIVGGAFAGFLTMYASDDFRWIIVPPAISFITGVPGGLAMLALIALMTQPLQQKLEAAQETGEPFKLPLPLAMLQALGKRSLSGYLFQSIVFFLLIPPFTQNLAPDLGIASSTLLAIAVWLLSILLAWLLERIGVRGPAEAFIRWFSSLSVD